VRGHVESFVCLNEINVVRRTPTAGDNNVSLLIDSHRMTGQILGTANLMRGSPLARIDTDRAPSIINYTIDAEARLDQRSDSFAFMVDGVAVKKPRTHPSPASAIYEVKR